jgi:hypothetical protein
MSAMTELHLRAGSPAREANELIQLGYLKMGMRPEDRPGGNRLAARRQARILPKLRALILECKCRHESGLQRSARLALPLGRKNSFRRQT